MVNQKRRKKIKKIDERIKNNLKDNKKLVI